jgi:hypothetical protein
MIYYSSTVYSPIVILYQLACTAIICSRLLESVPINLFASMPGLETFAMLFKCAECVHVQVI